MKNPLLKRSSIAVITLFGLYFACQTLYADNTATLLTGMPVQNNAILANTSQLRDEQTISIKDVEGEVYLYKNGSKDGIKLSKNISIEVGDTVRAKEGACNIYFDKYSYVVVFPNTELHITQAAIDKSKGTVSTNMRLDSGRLKIKVNKLAAGSKFEVKTPTAVAAVRGTLFYLNVGSNFGKLFTELYVDESKGGVLFTHIKSHEDFLVLNFNSSVAEEEGGLLPPHELTPEEQQDFKDLWDKLISKYIAQFGGIEQINLVPPPPAELTTNPGLLTDDASDDKESEQNIFGQSQDPADESGIPTDAPTEEDLRELERKSEGLSYIITDPGPSGEESPQDFEWAYSTVNTYLDYGIVTDLRDPFQTVVENNLSGESDSLQDPAAYGFVRDAIEGIREIERNQIREEIARMREDIDFEHADANLAQISDAQTGKVFTDIHGNRVRVDEYIFHTENSNTVEMLSLTLRTGDYQPGVSSIHLGIEFNTNLSGDVDLKSLPWSDYFNVVTGDELAERLQSQNVESQGFSCNLASQYIFHETNPDLAQGENAVYPTHFYADFSNPVRSENQQDHIRFDESYSNPETIFFESEGGSYLVQALSGQSTFIAKAGEESLLLLKDGQGRHASLYFNAAPQYNADTNAIEPILTEDSSAPDFFLDVPLNSPQAEGFAENYEVGSLVGSNVAFLEYTPAYTGELLLYTRDGDSALQAKMLINGFVPFDNQGNVLNSQGGFQINGLRDMFSPNPNVNNGNYNLEVLMVYGDVDFSNEGPLFTESFRIDTIITPEIFTPASGFNTVNDSAEFPATLSGESEPPGQYA